MPIEGPLRELGIHDVFQLLDLSRKTGVLRVTSQLRRNEGTIHFDKGAIVYAEIRSNPHPLGTLLVRGGKISEADLQRARDMQEGGDGRRLGEILVALGIVTAREVERQVRAQVEEVVFEVMGWREGYFSFNEELLEPARTEAAVRIPTEAVLMEGARRIDEWSRIARHIPHLGVVPALAPTGEEQEGELDLLPPEWEVLATIDGARDLRAIASALGRSEFDVAKTVFGLHSAGVVSVTDPGSGPAGGNGRDLDAGIGRVEALLDQQAFEEARGEAAAVASAHPTEPDAQFALARAHFAAGDAEAAEAAARRLLRVDPGHRSARRLVGDALAAQGRLTEATEWWSRWLAGEGADPEAAREVRAALEAARALDAYLRGAHGG